jgi:hypothetical protein
MKFSVTKMDAAVAEIERLAAEHKQAAARDAYRHALDLINGASDATKENHP